MTASQKNPQQDAAWRNSVRRLQWHLYSRDVEPHRASLSAYCMTLTRERSSADDLVQEALFRAFRVVGQLARGLDNPRAYLARIARNLWIDRLREARREAATDPQASERPMQPVAAAPKYPLEHVLGRLSERERQVFVLQSIYGYTLAEIGGILDISLAAAKMAGHRARQRLRSLYDDND